MFRWFASANKLIKKDSPNRLVLARPHLFKFWGGIALLLALVSLWVTVTVGLNVIGLTVTILYLGAGLGLITADRSVTIDAEQQAVTFLARYLGIERKRRIIPFAQIASVYLDYEEQAYYSARQIFTPQERVRRRWVIFLVLSNQETVTVARQFGDYPLGQAPNLSKQTTQWQELAEKICHLTDKFLVRTPSVPGRAPHTFVDVINQIVQRRLTALTATDPLHSRSVRLRSHPSGGLEIIIDGNHHRELAEISDPAVRNLIQTAVEEWKGLTGDSIADILSFKVKLSQVKD